MEQITINLPMSADSSEFEIKMLVAGSLYEKGKVSAGQAAEIVGISKRAFIELLGRFGFSVFGYGAEELAGEIEIVRKLNPDRPTPENESR